MGTGKHTKFGSGELIFKKALAKPEGFNVGEFAKAIAEDSGAMVKVSKLNDFAKLLKDNKCQKPVVHMGVSKGHLVITVQSADGFKDSEIIVKDYAKIKAAKANVAVVNAQKGDKTIDDSSDRMAKAKGTQVQDKKDAKLKEVTGDIIILAHGGNKGSVPGKVYASSFGDKKPKDIITFLVKKQKLPTSYSGTIYLDGCYTAAGASKGRKQGDLNNFCATVYAGLKKAGYSYLQVKGNLGLAVTKDDGSEDVVDAQMEAMVQKKIKPLQKKRDAAKKAYDKIAAKQRDLFTERKKYEAVIDKAPNDKVRAKVQAKIDDLNKSLGKLKPLFDKADKEFTATDKAKRELVAKLKKEGISDDKITDLIGTFGPEKLA